MENVKNGGAGSGDFNHAGNPPHVGGSEPIESRISRGFGKHKAEKTEKKEEKKEDKKEDKKVAETKIIEGGIKETTDKYGRTKMTKGNKWADVSSNGGKQDSWIAAYGQYLDKSNNKEEQLFSSKSFKTEKGAKKWALEQLKRISNTANNSLYKHEFIEY